MTIGITGIPRTHGENENRTILQMRGCGALAAITDVT